RERHPGKTLRGNHFRQRFLDFRFHGLDKVGNTHGCLQFHLSGSFFCFLCKLFFYICCCHLIFLPSKKTALKPSPEFYLSSICKKRQEYPCPFYSVSSVSDSSVIP